MAKKSTEERIGSKEYSLYLLRHLKYLYERNPLLISEQKKKQIEEDIIELKESIKHERKVQELEVMNSGRKEWWHNPIIYAIIYIGGIATAKVFDLIIALIN